MIIVRRPTMAESVTPSTVITQLVETMRALAGSHPGFRPVHAKGIVCAGTFRGAPEARRGGPARAPARPGVTNHHSLLQCEWGSGGARWPRQPTGAGSEISVTRWPEHRRP